MTLFQCGSRLGEDPGREDWDPAQALGLPLGQDNMGERQVWAGFEVSAHVWPKQSKHWLHKLYFCVSQR